MKGTTVKIKELEETIEEKEMEIKTIHIRLKEKDEQLKKEEERNEWYWRKIEFLMSLLKLEKGQ